MSSPCQGTESPSISFAGEAATARSAALTMAARRVSLANPAQRHAAGDVLLAEPARTNAVVNVSAYVQSPTALRRDHATRASRLSGDTAVTRPFRCVKNRSMFVTSTLKLAVSWRMRRALDVAR